MTTYEQWSTTASSPGTAKGDRKPYDIRIVDRFYGYCDAVARTHKHRDEAQLESQLGTRRTILALVLAGGLLCYYLLERAVQLSLL
jgi:hypothetical protein